ncbi:rhomboid family protein [Carex rostrata]
MADKPSRALVLYGDGLASLVSPSHSNLHSFASLSSCGFLSLRSPPSQDSIANSRTARDFAQLLDAYDFYIAKSGQTNESGCSFNPEYAVPELSKRFMGLRAAIFSSSPSIISLASDLSLSTLQLEETDSSDLRSQLLSLLGFSGQNILEASEYDLVFLHVTSETFKTLKGKSAIDWLDQLVGAILEIATAGSAVSSRLHLSVVLSYETSSDRSRISLVKEMNSDLGLLRPRQSYTMKNGKPLDEIRHDHPMLVAQWQDGVTRRDLANAFTFEEFNKNGGNLAMLADQFLHEVAFKLWKAPKYGA